MENIVIIDGNSLINRAYYAIQRPMITAEGIYTQGIFGFISMLQKIQKDYKPTHMLVAFDRKAPTFRHVEYAEYKAGRKKMPMELAMELPLLKDVLDAMGIYRYEIDGFEADDIIGTTAKMAEAAGLDAYIITGDKDALQLATDTTRVIITKKGITEFKLYDDAAMIEEYGFDHIQFIDYKGLRGDTSDNIPGIPGVGEVTAKKLLAQFGSIENMIANTDQIANAKLREKIEEGAMSAMMSKRLATIITNMPVDYTIEDTRLKPQDTAKLIELYSKLEFRKYLDALKKNAPETAEEDTAGDSEPVKEFEVVVDSDALLGVLTDGASVYADIASDDNHVELPIVETLQIAAGGKVYVAENADAEFLKKAFNGKNIKLSGFGLQRLYYVLAAYGVNTDGLTTEFDCSLAQYVLYPNAKAADLETLVFENFHEKLEKSDSQGQQIALFAVKNYDSLGRKFAYMEALAKLQMSNIEKNELGSVLTDIELPLCKILAAMEAEGITVDKAALAEIGEELGKQISVLEEEIYGICGEKFNLNSPKQLGVILFEKLQLPGAKKTKSGYATNADILDKLAPEYPVVEKILQYRTLAKLRSTYIEGLIPLIGSDGKIHAHFRQNVAATGRLSCTEPNLQNIPVRDEQGRQLRKLFTANGKNYILIGADYSQIELRVLAHMSGDETLIDAFNKGSDIHRETASKVFGVPFEDVTPQMRSNAKAVNFGVIYGMSSFGLADELTITRKQAEKYISDYFERFSQVKQFMDNAVTAAKMHGYSTTLYGRKRAIPEINASQYMVRQLGERLAMNTPIQGTAADIIKLAMIKVYNALKEKCPDSKMVLQIHDELIINTSEKDAEKVKELLTECMGSAAELKVKLEVSPESGDNWYQLK